MRLALTLLLLIPSTAHAYNGLAHKVIAAIAWQQLDKPTRVHIVAVLRRHPRFDDDFIKRQPDGVTDEGEWIFQHAATWPDLARSLPGEGNRTKYHRATWHYVNFPLFQGGERPLLGVNLSTQYPSPMDGQEWNIIQAYKHCLATLRDDGPPGDKALAYCWLLHLGGDAHQPLHSTALFSERFPSGDRGGNSIPTVQGSNLHSLWDGLLGSSHKPNDVKREVAELRQRPELFKVETGDIGLWIQESHELAKSYAYSPVILQATAQPGELAKVNLPLDYLKGAGDHARRRVAAAGVRLGTVIKELPISPAELKRIAEAAKDMPKLTPERPAPPVAADSLTPSPPSPPTTGDAKALTHWLNLNGNVRHNSSCRNFKNTKNGRPCTADEGRACGLCGG